MSKSIWVGKHSRARSCAESKMRICSTAELKNRGFCETSHGKLRILDKRNGKDLGVWARNGFGCNPRDEIGVHAYRRIRIVPVSEVPSSGATMRSVARRRTQARDWKRRLPSQTMRRAGAAGRYVPDGPMDAAMCGPVRYSD